MMQSPRIAVATLYTPELANIGKLTAENKRVYAQKHDYDCIVITKSLDTTRPASWSKIPLLLDLIDKSYDWVFWTDADSIITNQSIPLTKWTSEPVDILWTYDPSGINCGMMLVKCCEAVKTFLKAVWSQTQFIKHNWWEQAAVRHLIGAGYDIKHKLLEPKEFSAVPPETMGPWEVSNPESAKVWIWEPGDFIVHATGLRGKIRDDIIYRYMGSLPYGRSPVVVPPRSLQPAPKHIVWRRPVRSQLRGRN